MAEVSFHCPVCDMQMVVSGDAGSPPAAPCPRCGAPITLDHLGPAVQLPTAAAREDLPRSFFGLAFWAILAASFVVTGVILIALVHLLTPDQEVKAAAVKEAPVAAANTYPAPASQTAALPPGTASSAIEKSPIFAATTPPRTTPQATLPERSRPPTASAPLAPSSPRFETLPRPKERPAKSGG